MSKRILQVRRLGRIDYADGLLLQKETEQAVYERRQPDTLLLLEHPHTFTFGRRGNANGILATPELLAQLGVSVFETNRGGKVTYHGIGQIVGYPIFNLSPDREDVHRYVREIEESLIRAVGDFGLKGSRIAGLTGVHTQFGKVAAIGVHIKRWVTTHGFALNVNADLRFFNYIVACDGEPVASMNQLLSKEIPLVEVEDKIINRFAEVYDFDTVEDNIREPAALAA